MKATKIGMEGKVVGQVVEAGGEQQEMPFAKGAVEQQGGAVADVGRRRGPRWSPHRGPNPA